MVKLFQVPRDWWLSYKTTSHEIDTQPPINHVIDSIYWSKSIFFLRGQVHTNHRLPQQVSALSSFIFFLLGIKTKSLCVQSGHSTTEHPCPTGLIFINEADWVELSRAAQQEAESGSSQGLSGCILWFPYRAEFQGNWETARLASGFNHRETSGLWDIVRCSFCTRRSLETSVPANSTAPLLGGGSARSGDCFLALWFPSRGYLFLSFSF